MAADLENLCKLFFSEFNTTRNGLPDAGENSLDAIGRLDVVNWHKWFSTLSAAYKVRTSDLVE